MKTAKIIAILIIVALLGTIIIQNRASVQTHLLVVSIEMPLILLLLLTAGGGFFLGLLVALSSKGKVPTA
jgi:uncharacterized integral membrane protein